MMFYWKYAKESLKHGGQRIVIALLCIMFGVMSLTAMNSLARTIKALVLADPHLIIGGDANITKFDTDFLSSDDLVEVEAAYQSGEIERYSPMSSSYTLLMRVEDSSHAYFINQVYG